MREQVDLNLLVDWEWPAFLRHAPAFVAAIPTASDLSDLLGVIRADSVCAAGGLYASIPVPPSQPAMGAGRAGTAAQGGRGGRGGGDSSDEDGHRGVAAEVKALEGAQLPGALTEEQVCLKGFA